MSNATPGPWRVINHNWAETSIFARDRSSPVCSLGVPDENPEEEKRMDADAHLIAAAPDLLAACKELLGIVEATAFHEYTPQWREEERERARSAIAKAEQPCPPDLAPPV